MTKRFLILLLAAMVVMSPSSAQSEAEPSRVCLGVVLPLKEATNRGPKMVEFYRGVLLAADSLSRDGLCVDIEVYDCGRTADDMDSLLMTHSLAQCDVIFGPLDAVQVPLLSDYCNLHGIRLVQPFAQTVAQATCHPLHYVVTAPRDTVQNVVVDFVRKELSDHNYVLVDTHEQNEEGVALANAMRYKLGHDGAFLRLLDIDGNDMDFFQAFNTLRRNLVIINSPSLKALNKFLPRLKEFQSQYPDCQITLLGFPSWQTYTTQLQSDFHQFDAFVYTPFYRNPQDDNVARFEETFSEWFHTPVANTFPRYALMGFDLASFFLNGMARYGNEIEQNLLDIPPHPLQNLLYFVHSGEGSGYVNHGVTFVHFTRDNEVEVLMPTE